MKPLLSLLNKISGVACRGIFRENTTYLRDLLISISLPRVLSPQTHSRFRGHLSHLGIDFLWSTAGTKKLSTLPVDRASSHHRRFGVDSILYVHPAGSSHAERYR